MKIIEKISAFFFWSGYAIEVVCNEWVLGKLDFSSFIF